MNRDPVDAIGRWLIEQQSAEGTLAAQLRLCHVQAGGAQSICSRFPLERELNAAAAHELAARAYEVAIDHAAAFQSLQMFAAELWWPSSHGAGASKPFRVAPPADGLAPTESPTSVGLVTQTMRHLEATQKTLHTVIASVSISQTEAIKSRDLRISSLEAAHTKVLELVERLLDGTQQRELQIQTHKAGEARKDEMWQSMRLIASPILGQVGHKLLGVPQSAANDAQMVAFFTSLRPDQAEEMLSKMSDPQRVAFLTMYKRLVLDQIKDEPQQQPNPERH